MPLHIQDRVIEYNISIIQTNTFYIVTDKIGPNLNLFKLQAWCIFVRTCLWVWSNYFVLKHKICNVSSQVDWGCRIQWLLLFIGVRPHPQRESWICHKQSDGEVPVILELWGLQSTPSLPSLPGSLCPGVVALDKGSIYGLNRTKP